MGRPPKPEGTTRTERRQVLMTPGELKTIKAGADLDETTISEFLVESGVRRAKRLARRAGKGGG
jgi:uncharacterized protein (DUF1778 family)